MNIPIIVQASMTSSRLPGKMLKSVLNVPVLGYVIQRLQQCRHSSQIIVATSSDKRDLEIIKYCQQNSIEYFIGDLHNVAKRFFDLVKEKGCEHFVRICGDSPLIDARLVDLGIETYVQEDYEVVTNVFKRTFPKGESFEVFRSEAFIRGYHAMKSAEDLEHVSRFFYSNPQYFKIHNVTSNSESLSNVNLCIDTPEDFVVFEHIVNSMDKPVVEYTWEEIVAVYKSIKERSVAL